MNTYSIENYERPSVAVDMVVFSVETEKSKNYRHSDDKKLKMLLVKRGEEPFKGKYSLPGGFLRPGETTEDAAIRELEEETGICNVSLYNLNVYSNPERDPRGWIISCASLALISETTLETKKDSDVSEAVWAEFSYTVNNEYEIIVLKVNNKDITLRFTNGTFDKKNSSEIAFDHAIIIYQAYKKLQYKTKNDDIIFELLPEKFQISELQAIYEMILNKKESVANFRRKMTKKLIETDEIVSTAGHRPSKLFKIRKDD